MPETKRPSPTEARFLSVLLWLSLGSIFASLFFLQAPRVALETLLVQRQAEEEAVIGAAALSPREMERVLSRKTGEAFDRALLEMLIVERQTDLEFAKLAESRSPTAAVRAEMRRLRVQAQDDLTRLEELKPKQ